MVGRPHALSMPMRAARHNWLRRVHAMLGPCITGLAACSFVVALPTIASALGGDIVVGAAHGGCCGDVTRRGQAPLRREADDMPWADLPRERLTRVLRTSWPIIRQARPCTGPSARVGSTMTSTSAMAVPSARAGEMRGAACAGLAEIGAAERRLVTPPCRVWRPMRGMAGQVVGFPWRAAAAGMPWQAHSPGPPPAPRSATRHGTRRPLDDTWGSQQAAAPGAVGTACAIPTVRRARKLARQRPSYRGPYSTMTCPYIQGCGVQM